MKNQSEGLSVKSVALADPPTAASETGGIRAGASYLVSERGLYLRWIYAGDDLLSHTLSRAIQSALWRFGATLPANMFT